MSAESVYQMMAGVNDVAFIDDYYELLPLMDSNEHFLFDFAKMLATDRRYNDSNAMLRLGTLVSCDPMFYVIQGNNYSEMDFNQNTHILIDQAGFVEGDTDILKLTKVIQSDMQFFLQNNVLKVAHVSGGNIEILGWNENPIEKIYFADGESTAAGINEKTNS